MLSIRKKINFLISKIKCIFAIDISNLMTIKNKLKMKNVLSKFALLMLAILFGFSSCERDNELPTVSTNEIEYVGESEAETGGIVFAEGSSSVFARGVCYSTESNPLVSDNCTVNGFSKGGFYTMITGLTPATTYYARAYASNSEGTSYGEERCFTTEGLNLTFGDDFWAAYNPQCYDYPQYAAVVICGHKLKNQKYPSVEMQLAYYGVGRYTDLINREFTYDGGIIAYLNYYEKRSWNIDNNEYGDWWAESVTVNVSSLDLTAMQIMMNVEATMFELESVLDDNLNLDSNLLPTENRKTLTVNLNLPMMDAKNLEKNPIGK